MLGASRGSRVGNRDRVMSLEVKTWDPYFGNFILELLKARHDDADDDILTDFYLYYVLASFCN